MSLALVIALFISTEYQTDSLIYHLDQLSNDSDVAAYIEHNRENLHSYQKRISFTTQSLEIAKNKNFPLSEAKAQYLLGATYWAHAKYDNTKYHLMEALRQYKKLKLINPQADCYNTLGLCQFYLANYENAITYLDSALQNFKHQHDSSNIARVMNNLGLVHQKVGEYEKSIKYIVDALSFEVKYSSLVDQSNSDIYNTELHNSSNVVAPLISKTLLDVAKAKEKKDLKKYAKSTSDLGTLYQLINEHDSAFYYLNRSAKIYDSLGQKSNYLMSMLDIADGHTQLGSWSKGKEIYEKLLQEMESERMIAVMGNILEKLAKIDLDNKNYQSAGVWYKKAIELNDSVGHKASVAKMKLGLASSHSALGETTQALQHAQNARILAEEINSFSIRKESSLLLSEIYHQIRNYEKALFYQSIYLQMALIQKDSEAVRITKELEAKYELQTKAKEINKLDLKVLERDKFITRQTKYILALIIGLVLLAVFFIIILQRDREVRKLNIQIEKKNEDFETLLKEVHHRVKNNLQMIVSLLNMQQRRLPSENLRNTLALMKNRIKSIGLIHEHLYKHENFSKINLYDYVGELAHMIIHSMIQTPNKTKPKINLSIPSFRAHIDTAIPIGIIMNELITNSIKHAFEDEEVPEITIIVFEENNELIMVISDNGIGSTSVEKEFSFGFTIINTLVESLNGTITKESSSTGFKVTIVLKEYDLFLY